MLKVGAERPDTGYLDISRARKGSESLKASSCWYDRHQIRSWVAGLTSTRLLKAMCIYDQFKVVVGAKELIANCPEGPLAIQEPVGNHPKSSQTPRLRRLIMFFDDMKL